MFGVFSVKGGVRYKGFAIDGASYEGVALEACFNTQEDGMRKNDVARPSARTPFGKGRLRFQSLLWKLGVVEVRETTVAQLSRLLPAVLRYI